MTLLYWEWHLIPRWLFRSIFALFPEQLLNGLVSWGSPGKYSMIDYFLGDALGVLSCQFWNTALRCGARLPIHITHLKPLDRVVNGASFLTGVAFERLTLGSLAVVVSWSSLLRHVITSLLRLIPVRMCRCGLHAALWSHIGSLMRLLAAEPNSIAWLFYFYSLFQ